MHLPQALDDTPLLGLAVTFVHTGYNASIEWQDGIWSPHEFGGTASEAILKAIRLHAPVRAESAPIKPVSAAVTRVVVIDPTGVVAPILSPPPY